MCVIYLGVILPSFSIGNNQYAYIQYARFDIHYLESFRGILYITDGNGRYGLRDRYGLLIKPKYETIRIGEKRTSYWSHLFTLQKDSCNIYYDAFNNKLVQESDAYHNYSEGLANVRVADEANESNYYCKNGYIDKTGKMIIEPQYDEGKSFSEGLAAVKIERNSKAK